MYKRILLLSFLTVGIWFSVRACDACGCSIGGSGIGMLTAYRNSFVGVSWRQITFRGHPAHTAGATDRFLTAEINARVHFSDRFKVLFHQPYQLNSRSLEEETQRIDGIGDTRLIGSYTVLANKPIGNNFSIFLELGGGIKLPTGQYNASIHETDLPENFNIGNGSWGYIFQTNLVVNYRQGGLIAGGVFQYFSSTKENYRFGSQLTGQLLAFWSISLTERVKLLPNAAISVEYVGMDQFANGKNVHGTGGSGGFATIGANLKLNDFIIGGNFGTPIWQSYSEGEVEAANRFSIQVSYIF